MSHVGAAHEFEAIEEILKILVKLPEDSARVVVNHLHKLYEKKPFNPIEETK